MADERAGHLQEMLDARAAAWWQIVEVHETLVETGDPDAMQEFAALLLAMAADLRSSADHADPFCRAVLLTDADRYETTAIDLRLQAAG